MYKFESRVELDQNDTLDQADTKIADLVKEEKN